MDLYRSGDFNGAAASFLAAAQSRSGFFDAHYHAGKSLLKGFPTDLPGAEAQFLEAIRIRPQDTDGLIALAQNYYEWGRYEKAASALAEVLKRSPDHRGALYYSGVIAARRGDHARAVSLLQGALATDPRHIPSRLELGLSLGHLGRDAEALAAFEEVLKLDPGSARALLGVGTEMRRLGRIEESSGFLTRFREAATKREKAEWKEVRVQVWIQEAQKQFNDGRLDEARSAVDHLLQEFPDEPRGLASLGWVQEKLGQHAAALATYEKLLKIQPENLTANHRLVALYAKAGMRDRALAQKARYEDLKRRAVSDDRD